MNRMLVRQDRREVYYDERMRHAGPAYEAFDAASAQIAVGILYTYDLLHGVFSKYAAAHGLSKSTLNVLLLLRHGPSEGMQLHDLGELLLVSRANITGLIDHLEEKGYVRRVVDSADRRARFARITTKGENLLDSFMPLHYRSIRTLFQDLSSQEKEILVQLLRKTRASIYAHLGEFASQPLVNCPTGA
jgi:MarR family 2-MHQ and catechol resistance regulon transcriptional repressor